MRKVDIDMLTARLERKFHENGCPTKYVHDVREVLLNTPTVINNDDIVCCKDCARACQDEFITDTLGRQYQCGLLHKNKWVYGDFFCALGTRR